MGGGRGRSQPDRPANDRTSFYASLTEISGVPHVAWQERDASNVEQIRVARLNAAGTAWEKVGQGDDPASPINEASNRNGDQASLIGVGGVPHVAWDETDGTNNEIRVARLNAAGTGWDQIVGGASPVNAASDRQAGAAELLAIDGTPHLAWHEDDGVNQEVRVTRLNAAGTAWEQVVGGDSPINLAPDRAGFDPSLVAIGGVPYIAWEETDGTNAEIRAGRLEPDFLALSETVSDTSAALSAEVRTFGVPLPIAFEHGPTGGFGAETAPVTALSGNADSTTVTQPIGGLQPATAYDWRAFGTDTVRRTAISATRAFTTAAPLVPPTAAPAVPAVPADLLAPLITDATLSPRRWAVDPRGPAEARIAQRRLPRARRGTTFRYTLSEAARVVFRIDRRQRGRRVRGRCRRPTRANRGRRQCVRHVRIGAFAHASVAGPNRKRFSGRIGRRVLRPGRYRADADRHRRRRERLAAPAAHVPRRAPVDARSTGVAFSRGDRI